MSLSVDITHPLAPFELNVAFEAASGVTALFGRSGAGKTTVVQAVAGLLRPEQGEIRLGGKIFQDTTQFLPPHKRRIGYVFQDARLFPHLSVAQNLDYARRFGARSGARSHIIELLGLGSLLKRRPGHLSGGERQRVALGRALLSDPHLLLMDEPLAALDAARKADILPYLEALKAEARVPILYVSHAVEEIARLADQLVVLDQGRVVTSGTVCELLSDPGAMRALGVREAGSVIRARVVGQEGGLTVLNCAGGQLRLMGVTATEGQEIRLRILAQDVMISTRRPRGLSAQNILPAHITDIVPGDGPGVAVRLALGENRILARITARALTDLNLQIGQGVYAVLKATAVAPGAISGQTTAATPSDP